MKPVAATALLLFLACATGAGARVGETLDQLKTRYGRPSQQPRKGLVGWLFETTDDGQLLYTATINTKGISIAEGLKPYRGAPFTEDDAKGFIDMQIAPYRGSKTLLPVIPGQKYVFAGKDFVCGDTEAVIVDDENGILIVWNRGTSPSVMAVGREMIH